MNSLLVAALAAFPFLGREPARAADAPKQAEWTILFYGAADNSCEDTIVDDVADMAEGFVDGQGVKLLVMLDRSPSHSAKPVFGEDFSGTRLYDVRHGGATRLKGGEEWPAIQGHDSDEVDVGDARTLASFVRFGKAHFPARRYALVFYSHGNGKAMCGDDASSGNELFPAEISGELEERDSVDLLVFDVCSMAGIENAYEWRRREGSFGADALVASASVSGPLPYTPILRRLKAGGGASTAADTTEGGVERDLDPARTDALTLARMILEEKRDDVVDRGPEFAARRSFESWIVLDLARAADAKTAIDRWAAGLATDEAEERLTHLRGRRGGELAMHYMPRGEDTWATMPFFDLYEIARRDRDAAADPAEEARAKAVVDATDALVSASFGLADYAGFEEGRHGLWLLFPDGDGEERIGGKTRPQWQAFSWYSGDDVSSVEGAYGRYAWCRDGRASRAGEVGNWHQRLEAWFGAQKLAAR